MKINNISFPHPVLGIGDDVNSSAGFASPPHVDEQADRFIFKIKTNLEDKNIEKYIQNKNAIYTCEVSCVTTLYRKCFQSVDGSFSIDIPKSFLAGVVSFQFFITATKKFIYTNKNFHPDYANSEFALEMGDLLA